MAARLGQVLYWLACGLAVVFLGLSAFIIISWNFSPPDYAAGEAYFWMGFFAVLGVGSWRACARMFPLLGGDDGLADPHSRVLVAPC